MFALRMVAPQQLRVATLARVAVSAPTHAFCPPALSVRTRGAHHPQPIARAALMGALLLIAIHVSVTCVAAGSPDDAFWSSAFSAPAFDEPVLALVGFDGALIAGGIFQRTPGGMARGVARWDGLRWGPLGDGVYEARHLISYQGRLLAAGYVRSGAGVFVSGAQWDGRSWRSLGAPGQVTDLAVLDDQLVACGSFDWGDSVTIATRWDGRTWHPLGSRSPNDRSARDRTCTTYHDQLYVGGAFGNARDTLSTFLMRWTGSAWESLGVGANRSEVALTVHADTLYVGGEFTNVVREDASPPINAPLLSWDGQALRAVTRYGSNGTVTALASTPVGLLVGGSLPGSGGTTPRATLLGPSDTRDLPGLIGRVAAVGYHAGHFVAGASCIGSSPAIGVSAWDGASWRPIEGPTASGYGLAAGDQESVYQLLADGDTLFACGRFDIARNGTRWTPVSNVARWNGTQWSPMAGAKLNGWVLALARFRGELIAGGDFCTLDAPEQACNIARWDGSAWRPLGAGIDGQVRALAVMNDQLIAGGSLDRAGSTAVRGIARWNGYSWDAMGPIEEFGLWPRVNSLLVQGDTLYVGGEFSQLGGIAASNIAAWANGTWSQLGDGLDAEVLSLVPYERDLVASGRFPSVNGVAAIGLARWNRTAWQPFPGPSSASTWPQVFTMCASRHELFVGGVFEDVDGVAARNIARWDGSRWSALGSGIADGQFGTHGIVSTMTSFRGALYVGGAFGTSGGKLAANVARWDGIASIASVGPALALASGRPNPFARDVLVPFWLSAPAHVEAEVVDALGRHVRTLLDGEFTAGDHAVAWDGATGSSLRARAGIYFVTIRSSGGGTNARKVVLLP